MMKQLMLVTGIIMLAIGFIALFFLDYTTPVLPLIGTIKLGRFLIVILGTVLAASYLYAVQACIPFSMFSKE